MKKKWLNAYNRILVAALALTSASCSGTKDISKQETPPPCIYGPPTDFERHAVPEHRLMYGVPNVTFQKLNENPDSLKPKTSSDEDNKE